MPFAKGTPSLHCFLVVTKEMGRKKDATEDSLISSGRKYSRSFSIAFSFLVHFGGVTKHAKRRVSKNCS